MASKATVSAAAVTNPYRRAWTTWLPWCGLSVISIVGLVVRAWDLHLVSVSLSIDEARLALVARGLQEYGWPVLPSGKVYTRGIPAALSMVPSVSLLGQTDFAARLPSVLFGALTVPFAAAHAGRLGGVIAAVIAAVLIALYPPLISWSRQAWLFSIFVLLWVGTLSALDAALTRPSRRALVSAAVATALGLLTHELFLALLPCWLLVVFWFWRGQRSDTAARAGETAAATGSSAGMGSLRLLAWPLGIVAIGLVLLVSFTLTHRADTLAGRMSEVTEYFTLNTDLAGFRFYGRMLTDRWWLLLIAAISALALRTEPRRLLLLIAILPLFVVDAFILPGRPQERYGLALVPPMMVLAAVGLCDLASHARSRFPGPLGLALGGLLLVGVPLVHLDLSGVARRTDVSRISGTWLADLQHMGFSPGDVVMTDMPTVVQLYLGRTDYWLVSREYEKYAYRPDDQLREIHTNARLIRSADELDRALREELGGRRVWVVGSDRSYQWEELLDRSLRRAIDERAVARLQSEDSVRLFRLEP
jgi:hypothetical protein